MITENAGNGERRLGELLSNAAKAFADLGFQTPRLDAELILEHVLRESGETLPRISRSWLLAHPEYIIEKKYAKSFIEAAGLRAQGLPVAYVIGKKFFWKHEFEVSRDVLIPKPDTEILVERAEAALNGFLQQKKQADIRLLDVCTGSGCIAISLKFDFPAALIAGADISQKALAVAKKNAEQILKPRGECAPIAWIACDLREGIPQPPFQGDEPRTRWDIITANPPYVPSKKVKELLADGRSEPLLALDGGNDGLSLIKPLVFNAAKALVSGGFLLIEAGEYNADAAAVYFKEAGFSDIIITNDLAGQKRVVEGRLILP